MELPNAERIPRGEVRVERTFFFLGFGNYFHTESLQHIKRKKNEMIWNQNFTWGYPLLSLSLGSDLRYLIAAATAAAAAKSLQSCLTLCNPIDGLPPGSPPCDSPGKNTGVGCHFLLQCMKVKSESEVAQSCPTLGTWLHPQITIPT